MNDQADNGFERSAERLAQAGDVLRERLHGERRTFEAACEALEECYTDTAPEDAEPESDLLAEALEITSGDRQRFYGHPLDNHGCTADLWQSYLARRQAPHITPRDVCIMNILQKISRDANAPNRDNLRDIIGYAENADECDKERKRRQ